MRYLLQLSQASSESNALAFLYKALMEELGGCTLGIVNSVGLAQGCFQLSGFCDQHYCPIYSPDELLLPSDEFPVYQGDFIEVWKAAAEPFTVLRSQAPDLFRDNLQRYEIAFVLPIWHDREVERWLLVLESECSILDVDTAKLALIANYAFSSMARVVEKRQLKEAQQWIDREINEMARLQKLLLPEEDTSIPGVELAFRFKAYKQTSGDYLDISSLGEDQPSSQPHEFGAMIADVAGHGPSAAVEAAMLDAIVRTYRPAGDASVDEFLNYLNTHFFTRKHRGKFITLNTFHYEPALRRLNYCSAGHPVAYIKRDEQVIPLSEAQDIPVGVLRDYRWQRHEFAIERGDILFMYTDVVLETRNTEQQEFGRERLEALIKTTEACPHCVVDAVEEALQDFCAQNEFEDDLTLCAIQFLH
ncbi:serine/threonine-protein phosphatase [Exilibacterium tricleocarpae]|uniref:Serine/threonine-protein phosphatase n=1 Tax=Exilibacterium tricleocarpae TaxID=2591008 RepID=A0A545U9E8_9GAMM|nr:PP2C family protein-serine/threonine phosphatase [Exilibacterium tricleocarpae]TQV86098.1 serine/threonine-protein phosphatase [Exilibacterium tricleocarpae]